MGNAARSRPLGQVFSVVAAAFALAGLAGCGATVPPPTDRLAATDAAIRSAHELGAQTDPQASLHLKLAEDQRHHARKLMTEGEHDRANLILQRASSDAELAVMLTKERAAKSEAQKTHEQLNTNTTGK
jgi:hypothetical protein